MKDLINPVMRYKDWFLTLGTMIIACAICFLLFHIDKSLTNSVAMPIFIFAVLIVSRFANGFQYGLVASLIGTFAVNYYFTYPYFRFNLTISGYPITFFTMFAVSGMVCMLTNQIKRQSKIRTEIENEKNRTNLLRSISHDIRTPLTSIIGSSSALLDNSNLSDDAKNMLISDIKSEAEWLIRMVENILSITRVNNASDLIGKNPEMLEEIIGETAHKFKKQFPGIALNISVPDKLLFVTADAMLIEQVILNALENAVYHGGSTTKIDISVTDKGGCANIKICDNGNGIDGEILKKLKQGAFVKEHTTAPDIKRNMGIGISVCKGIITAHGGTLSLHNGADGGAVFEFTLPLAEPGDDKFSE